MKFEMRHIVIPPVGNMVAECAREGCLAMCAEFTLVPVCKVSSVNCLRLNVPFHMLIPAVRLAATFDMAFEGFGRPDTVQRDIAVTCPD